MAETLRQGQTINELPPLTVLKSTHTADLPFLLENLEQLRSEEKSSGGMLVISVAMSKATGMVLGPPVAFSQSPREVIPLSQESQNAMRVAGDAAQRSSDNALGRAFILQDQAIDQGLKGAQERAASGRVPPVGLNAAEAMDLDPTARRLRAESNVLFDRARGLREEAERLRGELPATTTSRNRLPRLNFKGIAAGGVQGAAGYGLLTNLPLFLRSTTAVQDQEEEIARLQMLAGVPAKDTIQSSAIGNSLTNIASKVSVLEESIRENKERLSSGKTHVFDSRPVLLFAGPVGEPPATLSDKILESQEQIVQLIGTPVAPAAAKPSFPARIPPPPPPVGGRESFGFALGLVGGAGLLIGTAYPGAGHVHTLLQTGVDP